MKLPPLTPGVLLRRYKRFLADVRLEDGSEVTVHCPNPGSMMGLSDPGTPVWVSDWADAVAKGRRKLRYTLELMRLPSGLVGINTGHPNRIVAEAVAEGRIPELAGYPVQRAEVRYGRNSRVDILLQGTEAEPRPDCFVEVKNVHLRRPDGGRPTVAEFPDSVTARGAKHLDELGDRVEAGERGVMVYLIQRMDCDRFGLAEDLDPAYAEAFRRARARGVEAVAWMCEITVDEISAARSLPIVA